MEENTEATEVVVDDVKRLAERIKPLTPYAIGAGIVVAALVAWKVVKAVKEASYENVVSDALAAVAPETTPEN